MKRRRVIKSLLVASGGLITLPAWISSCGISDKSTHQSSFSASEQEMLAKIADTIIPAGQSIGALAVGADKFLQVLIDDCYEKEVQDNVKTQMKSLEASAGLLHNQSFASCTQAQRQDLLMKLSLSENKAEKDFFNLMKSETIRGFNTSREVMEKYLHYKVAPGHYYGCIDLKA